MQKCLTIAVLSAAMFLGGCSARPVSKTWHTLKKGYNTTKQVVRTTRAVVDLVNPLEYMYVSEHGEALDQQGEPFVTGEAVLGPASADGE